MQRRMRARTARMVAALFALSLMLSACDMGALLELLGGGVAAPAPVEQPAPAEDEPAPDDDDEPAPAEDEPAPDDDDEPAPDDDASAGLSNIEQEIFETLNATRTDAGLAALTLSADIAAGARAYSCTMAETGVFEHADLRQAGVNGENIAAGQRSAAEVHTGWMNSPGHRDNRMSNRWTEYGIGVCEDGGGRLYFTERFR